MHPRRMLLAALAVLLLSGCVAVPNAPAPAPPPRQLGPADAHPPAPLPTSPAPTPATPREALDATDPRPTPAKNPPAPAAAPEAAGARPAARPALAVPARQTTPTTTRRPGKTLTKKTKSVPRQSTKPTKPRRQPTAGQVPEIRHLCRQAQQIQAPMGAGELCRTTYGR
ncbi:hypothetical protein ACFVFF_38745 [Streptomyces sp. NPDC057680]|uniref:hypothetical protein n=1 Tax=Streptomyces sp. NPDC057680 TaxID=3346208 RepID=UPI0036B60C70